MRARTNNEEMLTKYTAEGTCGCQLTFYRNSVHLACAGWCNALQRLHKDHGPTMKRRRIRVPKFVVAGLHVRTPEWERPDVPEWKRPDVPEWISTLESRLYSL